MFDALPWPQAHTDADVPHKAKIIKSEKQPLVLPPGGTWRALKQYVGKARNVHTVRELIRSKNYRNTPVPAMFRPLESRVLTIYQGTELHDDKGPMVVPSNSRHRIQVSKSAIIAGAIQLVVGQRPDTMFIRSTNRYELRAVDLAGNDIRLKPRRTQLGRYYKHHHHYHAHPVPEETPGFKDLFWF